MILRITTLYSALTRLHLSVWLWEMLDVVLVSQSQWDAGLGAGQNITANNTVSLSYMILTTACWSSIAVEPHVMGSENVVTRITVSIILNCFISVELRCNLYSFWDCRPRYISRNYFGLNSSPLELSLCFCWYQNVIFSLLPGGGSIDHGGLFCFI